MPKALITLPDGTKARISFDSQDQLDSTVQDLTDKHAAKFGHFDYAKGRFRGVGDVLSETIGEPALQFATGAVGAAVGGAQGTWDWLTGQGTDKAAQDIESAEQALTRTPRTPLGKGATEVVSVPFTLLARGADWAGRKTAEATGSPLAGAVVNTGLQAAPAALIKGGTRLARSMRTPPAAATEVPPGGGGGSPPGTAAVTAPTTPPQAPAELTATGSPRPPPSEVGQVAPESPQTAPQAPVARAGGGQQVPRGTAQAAPQAASARPTVQTPPGGGQTAPTTPTSARAQAYAERIGLDWTRLGAGTRAALTTIAEDAGALDRLNPAAVRRQAHLEQLRVPVRATRGQLERDPVQLRREAIASNTQEGQPIRDVDIAANRDLQANLEVLRGRVAGRRGDYREPVTEEGVEVPGALRGATKAPTQVGESVQAAARGKERWSQKGYQALYKIARETDPDARAALKPVTDLLTENPDIQHLGWVQSWLNKARSVLPKDEQGNLPELKDVTLNELDDLRQLANKNIKAGGTAGHYAGQLKEAIDTAMQDVPEGAAAWKRATDAFRKHKQEFADQGVVRQMVSQKRGNRADRALALEKTWQTLATGTRDALRQAKRTLTTGGTPETRMAGRKAWRDLRAETVNRILEDARNVTSADEEERAILTEAALRSSLKRVPRENLEELIGKANTRELYDILRARRITTRSPVGGRTTQSGTIPNALVMAEKILKHIPGVKYAIGAKHAIQELGERGAAARDVREAGISPLEQAAEDVRRGRPDFSAEKRAAQYRQIEGAGPSLPTAPSQPNPVPPVRRPP